MGIYTIFYAVLGCFIVAFITHAFSRSEEGPKHSVLLSVFVFLTAFLTLQTLTDSIGF